MQSRSLLSDRQQGPTWRFEILLLIWLTVDVYTLHSCSSSTLDEEKYYSLNGHFVGNVGFWRTRGARNRRERCHIGVYVSAAAGARFCTGNAIERKSQTLSQTLRRRHLGYYIERTFIREEMLLLQIPVLKYSSRTIYWQDKTIKHRRFEIIIN